MKTIYKAYGLWSEGTPSESDPVELTSKVADDVNVGLMNSIHYSSPTFDLDAYNEAVSSSKISEAKTYLLRTDYVSAQWRDEEELGIEHSRTEESYRSILQKRQEARELIRSLSS